MRTRGCAAALHEMSFGSPAGTAPGARTNIALLDSSSVYINLGKHAAVTVRAKRPQNYFAGRNHRTEALLCGASARLIELGRIDVRQPNFLPMAHQRIAVYRNATLAGVRDGRCGEGKARRDCGREKPTAAQSPRCQTTCSPGQRPPLM